MTYAHPVMRSRHAYDSPRLSGGFNHELWSMAHWGVWVPVTGRDHWIHGKPSMWSSFGYTDFREDMR